VDIETGKEREITNQKFFNIQYISWLPDKSGLLFSASDRFFRPVRIYQVSNDTGEVKALTNDSNNYNHLSPDSSFNKMVITQFVADFRLMVAPVENINSAVPVGYANGRCNFSRTGKLVYSSVTDGNFNIWIINADGTNQRQLTSNQGANLDPRISGDERYIFFTSNRSGMKQVWRMNMDGTNQIQISQEEGGTPFFASTDGNTVYYETAINSNLGKITINNDGSIVSNIISNERLLAPEVNPAEDTVAFFSRKSEENIDIVLMSLADGKILKTFNVNRISEFRVIWANDGKSLFYLTRNELKATIWQLFLNTGKIEKFTEFNGDDDFEDFHFSPDGKTFAFIRGKWRHDAFLITGLK
ncbi:MAG TPA: DPP IV N-terminal domain-containing protein, partial [Pyrinomonadaceae bacterium]|nr:DPP IV N-terminal domain-containing protein [Pyrinomonadaceae bacterium]